MPIVPLVFQSPDVLYYQNRIHIKTPYDFVAIIQFVNPCNVKAIADICVDSANGGDGGSSGNDVAIIIITAFDVNLKHAVNDFT